MQQYYSFSSLEKFIHVDLQHASRNQQQPDEHFFKEAVNRIADEKRAIFESIRYGRYCLENQEQVYCFVQQHQQCLVLLMDQVSMYLDAGSLLNNQIVAGGCTTPATVLA